MVKKIFSVDKYNRNMCNLMLEGKMVVIVKVYMWNIKVKCWLINNFWVKENKKNINVILIYWKLVYM